MAGAFGKYQLIAELGHGGMADVFLAVAKGPKGFGFNKLLVIKRLRPDRLDDPDFISMLVDEARIAARLNHPNVVQTIEVGKVGRQYFIAMEYLDGQPLHRVLRRGHEDGGMPAELQYLVLSDMLGGLHHAHELRGYDGKPLHVVHRDVTPHNVFVTYDGVVKVVDFGIAKAAGRATQTDTGIVKGKVRYMAPEQATGDEDLDRRVDVFAAGIMLWEAATGRRFWGHVNENMAVMHRLLAGDFEASPRAVAPDVPEAIDAMCQKALALDPDDRYQTAAELQADLDRYIDSLYAAAVSSDDSGELGSASQRRHVANRDLGDYVAELFEKERADLGEVIERQMSALEEAADPSQVGVASVAPIHPASHSALGEAETRISGKKPGDRETEATATNLAAEPPTRSSASRRPKRLALALIAVAGVAGVALVLTSTQPSSSELNAPLPAASEPAPSAAPSPGQVRVSLRAEPSAAVLLLDGKRLAGNPFHSSMDRDEREHALRVEAEGYEPEERTLRFDRDIELAVALHPAPTQSPKPSPRARPAAAVTPAPKPIAAPKRPLDEELPW